MNTTVAALLFGVAVLIVVAILLWRAGDRGAGAKVSLSFGQLFEARITLDEKNASSVESAVRRATEERGGAVVASPVHNTSTRLARLLWVDDNPDNNLYETVALEQLGRLITKTTSTEAAMRYLDELPFALIITDASRGNNDRAGEELVRKVRATGRTTPIVVYTLGTVAQRDHLRSLGADAIVDMPNQLVREVNDRLATRLT